MSVTVVEPSLEPVVTRKQRASSPVRVAYLMSRFPKITETFVLREMIELAKIGIAVEVFPLRREKTKVMQPEAASYVDRAHFTPLMSWPILWSNLAYIIRRPWRYLTTLGVLIRANWGSLRYLTGALVYYPKSVYLAARMRELSVSHVHAHFASHPAAVAYVINRLGGISYSFTAHGSDLHRDQHMLLEKTRDAAFVVAISDYNRNLILDVCGRQFDRKVHVVHCGVDTECFAPRIEPTKFDRGAGPFTIVCVGTLHEVKGQTYLIDACRILQQRGIEFRCHFLGGGKDEPALCQQAKQAALEHCVLFHGTCTTQTVRNHLWEADVLVAPSVLSREGRREGIPVVLMEAMACGVPCVASRISGIPELVEGGSTGILTPPRNVMAIADALQRLAVDSSLRRHFGAASVKKVTRYFNLAENSRALARLFPLQPRATS